MQGVVVEVLLAKWYPVIGHVTYFAWPGGPISVDHWTGPALADILASADRPRKDAVAAPSHPQESEAMPLATLEVRSALTEAQRTGSRSNASTSASTARACIGLS